VVEPVATFNTKIEPPLWKEICVPSGDHLGHAICPSATAVGVPPSTLASLGAVKPPRQVLHQSRRQYQESSPPVPLTLDQKVDQLLADHPQIKYDVCSEYKHLLAVGWPDEMARGLLIGKQGIAMLSNEDVKLIEGVGNTPKDATKVVDMLVARCS
jgi:hypothetical protein